MPTSKRQVKLFEKIKRYVNYMSKDRLPAGNYMFKVNNTRAKCKICYK